MNTTAKKVVSALVCTMCLTVLAAQPGTSDYDPDRPGYEYDLLGKGARAAGMGYAFNAVADNVMAIFWNPAGTALIKKPEYGISGKLHNLYMAHTDYTSNNTTFIYYMDFIGFAYPMNISGNNFTLGAAFQNQISYETNYENSAEDQLKSFRSKVTINTISLSAAYAIIPQLMMGASINYWFPLGKETTGSSYQSYDPDDKARFSYYTRDSKYSGTNFSVGVLGDLSSLGIPLRLGTKFESGFNLEAKIVSEDNIFLVTGDRDTVSYYTEKAEGIRNNDMPWRLASGVSYRFGDYFTIALDYDIKPFKGHGYTWEGSYSSNEIKHETDTTFSIRAPLTDANVNLNQFRIGFEYILHPRKLLIPVRAGWKTNRTSLAHYDYQKRVTGPVNAFSLNLGGGIVLNRIAIDLASELYYYIRDVQYPSFEQRMYLLLSLSAVIRI